MAHTALDRLARAGCNYRIRQSSSPLRCRNDGNPLGQVVRENMLIRKFLHSRFPIAFTASLAGITGVFAQASNAVPSANLALGGDRIESLVVLGVDNAASGGLYSFRNSTPFDLKVSKLGGSGDIGDPRPLGVGGLTWNPTVGGNIGGIEGENNASHAQGPLAFSASMRGVEFGGGVRIWFNDRFSTALNVSGIYSRAEGSFAGFTSAAQPAPVPLPATGAFDWSLDTWSVAPGADLKYYWRFSRAELFFRSTFTYFHTESFNASSPLINLSGDSETWENRLDLDIPLGKYLFGRELHTGGHIDHTGLFGSVRDGLNTNHLYMVNGRLVVDMTESYPWLTWLGVGLTYTWSGNLSGWSVGIDARLKL
jgi:hypothetical protein